MKINSFRRHKITSTVVKKENTTVYIYKYILISYAILYFITSDNLLIIWALITSLILCQLVSPYHTTSSSNLTIPKPIKMNILFFNIYRYYDVNILLWKFSLAIPQDKHHPLSERRALTKTNISPWWQIGLKEELL